MCLAPKANSSTECANRQRVCQRPIQTPLQIGHNQRPIPLNGRKVQFPGWDLGQFFFTGQYVDTAELTIAIAPDNAYEAIVAEINAAQSNIQIETLTF